MEKPQDVKHLEEIDPSNAERQDGVLPEGNVIDIHDENYNKKINRQLDLRVLPLCCWVYLLNFLDRGTSIRISSSSNFLRC